MRWPGSDTQVRSPEVEIFVRRINANQVVFSPGRESVTYFPRDPFFLSGVPRHPLCQVIIKAMS